MNWNLVRKFEKYSLFHTLRSEMCASSLNFLALRTSKSERVKSSYHELVSIEGGFKGLQRRLGIAEGG